MTIVEFIKDKYNVIDKIKLKLSNPIEELLAKDDFKYDFIEMDNGVPTKMLYYNNGDDTISVLDLLSYFKEDLYKTGNKPLIELYDIYTQDLDIELINLIDTSTLTRMRDKALNRYSTND